MVKSLSPQEKIERITAEVGTQLHRVDDMVERAEACKHARVALTTMSTQLADVYRQTALEMLKAGTPHVAVAAKLGVSSHRLYKMKEKAHQHTEPGTPTAGVNGNRPAKTKEKNAGSKPATAKTAPKPRATARAKVAVKPRAKTSRTKTPA